MLSDASIVSFTDELLKIAEDIDSSAQVRRMAKKMEVNRPLHVVVKKDEGAGQGGGYLLFKEWSGKKKDEIHLSKGVPEAIAAHELGHSKNHEAIEKALKAIGLGEKSHKALQTASGVGHVVGEFVSTISTMMAMGGKMKPDSVKKAVLVTLALKSPRLLDEGAASLRAASHLMEEHGVKDGLLHSLHLLPGFASYVLPVLLPFAGNAYGQALQGGHA